ncbi:MAG: hypothetical protein WCJ84_02435 [Candidatus Peregrinibacteria bacterium]
MEESKESLKSKVSCPICESTDQVIKHGLRKKKNYDIQLFKCKNCGSFFDSFTAGRVQEETQETKDNKISAACFLYKEGASLRRIAKFFKVSHTTIDRWISPFLGEKEKREHAINAIDMTPEKEDEMMPDDIQYEEEFFEQWFEGFDRPEDKRIIMA